MIEIYAYQQESGLRTGVPPGELPGLLKREDVQLWVDLFQPSAEEERVLTEVFRFHPLEVEDCQSIHYPKIEEFDDHLFIVMHGLAVETTYRQFITRQLAFFLGRHYLVSYHLHNSRSIRTAKEACQKNPQKLAPGCDNLLHTILDYAVDMYLPILEDFDRAISQTEERIFAGPDSTLLNEILTLKRSILQLRKISLPQREIVSRLSRDDFPFVSEKQRIYFRDVYDHLVRVSDLAESYRELISGAQDAYLSTVSNRLNETVKILTLFASIFIPLTFIAGIYGMNFNMPEFAWSRGYLFAWAIMGLVLTGTLFFFKRRRLL